MSAILLEEIKYCDIIVGRGVKAPRPNKDYNGEQDGRQERLL